MAPKVLLAAGHVIVARGLESLLWGRFDLVGSVHHGRALMAAVEELSPDVVVTDLSMPGLNGLEAIRRIKKSKFPGALIVLTMHANIPLAVAMLRAGASGYLLKTSAVAELELAIERVLAGGTYVSSLIHEGVISELTRGGAESLHADRLTSRQREVLQLVAEGHTMKEVGSLLGISARTAESHKYQMRNALGCHSTAELIHYALNVKMISR